MNVPDDRRYSEDHEWAMRDGEDIVIGISAFAVDQLGDVVFVELPDPGAALVADAAFGVIESAKAASDLLMPIAGEVIASNPALSDSPELVNDDPYGEGWMLRLKPTDPAALDALRDAAAYRELIAAEEA